jgi:signal transduction histidine kinase
MPLHFEVHPSVIYQLGESLVVDAIQALIELVKNSYDADATYAKVVIDTQGAVDVDGALYSSTGGRIIVEDDGNGMGMEDIESGWFTISNRHKRDLKEAKKTTPGGRTPLGDKGLGRLAAQRLGQNLEILTKAEESGGYHFGFSWLDFSNVDKMENVKIHFTEIDYPRQHGSKVVVSGLREPDFWQGQKAIKRLEQQLSQMISPYRQIRDFTVLVEVDGKPLELLEVSDRVLDIAPIKYSLTFDGARFLIRGYVRLEYFRPDNAEEAEQFALSVESDDGEAFFDFLQNQKESSAFTLTRPSSKQWFAEFCWQKPLADLDKVQRIDGGDGGIANPGPFAGEIHSFDLGSAAFKNQSVFDAITEYRRYIKELSGVRVYRDSFAIRLDHDWLKLGAQWTSASSYYGLKPGNTLGYIALSARDNMELEETTDREGFKDSPYFRNFCALMEEFKLFSTRVHSFFGRSWVEFRRKRNEELAQTDSKKTVEDISRTIKTTLAEAAHHKESLIVFESKLNKSVSASNVTLSRLKSAEEITPELRENLTDAVSDLERLLIEAKDMADRLSGYLVNLDSLQKMEQVLEDRFDGLRRQTDNMYEAIALGLTAEALSHEVFNVADQLAKRVKLVQTALRGKGVNDRSILLFLEYVQSSVMALRKQMSFLSPSLRYVRDQRHDIDVSEFFTELAKFYRERLEKNKIAMTISRNGSALFAIRMNRGKLTQIIDNLILNSEYWLKEDIAQGRISSGIITLDVSRPFVRVFDDGSGIDPRVEHILFEPFVSAKQQGRGLGLFIVKQLLDSEGCSIGIVPERNRHERLFKFQIDLRGAIHE